MPPTAVRRTSGLPPTRPQRSPRVHPAARPSRSVEGRDRHRVVPTAGKQRHQHGASRRPHLVQFGRPLVPLRPSATTGDGCVRVIAPLGAAPALRLFPIGLADVEVRRVLADFRADMVRLPSPSPSVPSGCARPADWRPADRRGLPDRRRRASPASTACPPTPCFDRWVARIHRRADPHARARRRRRVGPAAGAGACPTCACGAMASPWTVRTRARRPGARRDVERRGTARGRRASSCRARCPRSRSTDSSEVDGNCRRAASSWSATGRRRGARGPARRRFHRVPAGRRAAARLRVVGRLRRPSGKKRPSARTMQRAQASGVAVVARRRQSGRPRRDRTLAGCCSTSPTPLAATAVATLAAEPLASRAWPWAGGRQSPDGPGPPRGRAGARRLGRGRRGARGASRGAPRRPTHVRRTARAA